MDFGFVLLPSLQLYSKQSVKKTDIAVIMVIELQMHRCSMPKLYTNLAHCLIIFNYPLGNTNEKSVFISKRLDVGEN